MRTPRRWAPQKLAPPRALANSSAKLCARAFGLALQPSGLPPLCLTQPLQQLRRESLYRCHLECHDCMPDRRSQAWRSLSLCVCRQLAPNRLPPARHPFSARLAARDGILGMATQDPATACMFGCLRDESLGLVMATGVISEIVRGSDLGVLVQWPHIARCSDTSPGATGICCGLACHDGSALICSRC